MHKRKLKLPPPGTETFFLWGPRQTGKTTLLRQLYPDAVWVDLLKSEEYRRYLNNPERLRQELLSLDSTPFVVIDEVQKLPILLDEVHWLHENLNIHFALCGSSARKIRRGHANLLGGRAIRYEMFGFVSVELGQEFDLCKIINQGYLPRVYLSTKPHRLLDAYVSNYLKEEVAAEGLVRTLPIFSNFLGLASLSDTEPVNFSTIARDCGVSSQTVREYFQILEDTLLGRWLPSYRKRPKRRIAAASKFYFADVGVVNFLAKRGPLAPGSELFGKAFENWCFHELSAYNKYREAFAELYYWRLAGGTEVDFIINDCEIAIEAKATGTIHASHLKGLRSLIIDHPNVKRRLVVCNEPKMRRTEDNIEIIPAHDFAAKLWNGEFF
ncbi:MAG: ATP-binding protein [Desulfofustis sp. PB-SRB1]|jgi:predicted AAA+ superfamily ATPase|nr:ATP-binding protein [Desulfofustis sp. PB-SRB1]MBM1003832.1 ATP-binding protein [Desulfofustis sp. PB-SRB1]HBH27526.1 AAA family ATPase [Desulfofustis sp.]